MKALVKEYGTGIESIDFSISDNLDQLSDSIKTYWQKTLRKNSGIIASHPS